ncbi:MAG: AraC family transcriptional regulator [Maribacter sp.]|nr:AraC family transcriptional regulator [Maribacter sp.]
MKKFFYALVFILLGTVIWYFFIKSHDYQVSMNVKTFPGTINQSIKSWSNSMDYSEMTGPSDPLNLTQKLQFGDSTHIYSWKIIPETDSTSRIKVYVRDTDNSFKNKLNIPFADTDFEKRTRKSLLDFLSVLKAHIGDFKVKIIGQEELKSKFCACTNLSTSQVAKAAGMIKDYPLLDGILARNNVTLNGRPVIEITEWDRNKDSITFNFCYPIEKSDLLPQHKEITYKNIPGRNALKAIYNGNYITSDRAWYALLDYAAKNGIAVTGLPIEIFNNNPNMGTNELEWETEVFMPLKE